MQRIGGVSRYFYENITRIEKEHKVNVCTLFLSNEYFKGKLRRLWFNPKNQKLIYLRIIMEEAFLWFNLKFSKYDVVHVTAERLSTYRWTKKPIVITIHDMIPEIYNINASVIGRRKYSVEHSDRIICVSENTKSDLLRIYPFVPEKKISVIYHGHTPRQWNYRRQIDGKYVLYVGARTKEYKNFDNLVKAIAPILKDYDLKLVCTGQKFNTYEEDIMRECDIVDKVVNVGFVEDSYLASLYHFAECFIYPSSYEGFGIPILESWEHDCPACISNASCFPEIGGDAVSYFEPDNLQSIYESIKKLVTNPYHQEELRRKGRDRLNFFTWDKAAVQTLNIYKSLL